METEEVRVAMALNGGVSLAVWMGGCAVELDCARRAHVSPEADPGAPERRVYHALATAFRRELVLDLMSGSSAGGINGALLATAIVHDRRLSAGFIREQWLTLGDLGALLHPTSAAQPQSLMDGEYFKRSLRGAFAALTEGHASTALPAEQEGRLRARDVALEVTTTDVAGRRRAFRDAWGEELIAHEYRARFSFATKADYEPDRLATAARSSASFPAAFEPSAVIEDDRGTFTGWAIDGGVLDNAPIKTVLDLIPTRRADGPVQRFVLYLIADPPLGPDTPVTGMPPLQKVLGYALNLPRKAPFVDHLYAVERATSSGGLADQAEQDLLTMDPGPLAATATALLPTYRRRRRLVSIRDLAGEPSCVEPVYDAVTRVESTHDLPWVPTSLAVPGHGDWGWGARAAQRIVHLLLDCTRLVLADDDRRPPSARDVYALRGRLYGHFDALDRIHRAIVTELGPTVSTLHRNGDVAARLDGLQATMRGRDVDPAIRAEVERAAEDAFGVLGAWFPRLFGDGPALDLATFLGRALAIEVVRRAFAADETFQTAQRLKFAQLTPCAPAYLFPLAERYGRTTYWDTPAQKLTGVDWGHFAAFYRESWRANDFMWGRLDAATRIMDLLVCPDRARLLALAGAPPWTALAEALLPDEPPAGLAEVLATALGVETVTRADLQAALERDLGEHDGALTRKVCAVAAQFEILRQELPILVRSSQKDVGLGTAAPALDLDPAGPWPATLQAICEGRPFPERLGRDRKDEAASPLALRTSTHAALVSLAALRTTNLPLTKTLFAVRTPLLPIAGLSSLDRFYRYGVVLAFCALAALLAARVATTEFVADPLLADAWSQAVLVTYLALLGLVAIVAVPAWSAARGTGFWARAWPLGWTVLLIAAGGGVAVALALRTDVDQLSLAAQTGAVVPPGWMMDVVVAVTLALPLALPIPGLGALVGKALAVPWAGKAALGLILGPWVLLGASAWLQAITDEDLTGWGRSALLITVVAAPAVMLLYVRFSRNPLVPTRSKDATPTDASRAARTSSGSLSAGTGGE